MVSLLKQQRIDKDRTSHPYVLFPKLHLFFFPVLGG